MKHILAVLVFGWVALMPSAHVYACSCANYYSKAQASQEELTEDLYSAAGSVLCSGIKSLDEKKAASESRLELSKYISSEVSVTENLFTRKNSSIGVNHFSSNAALESKTHLSKSYIANRWVDVDNCVVFAQAAISKSDLEKSLSDLTAKKNAKLISKNMCLDVIESSKNGLESILQGLLVREGFNVSKSGSCEVFVYASADTTLITKQHMESTLDIKFTTPERLIWQNSYQGKAISFNQNVTERELSRRAAEDSLQQLQSDLGKLSLVELE